MSGYRWPRLFCKHEHVRCTHGDEIIGRGYRRRVCLDCGKALKGPLPEVCWFTGQPHFRSGGGRAMSTDSVQGGGTGANDEQITAWPGGPTIRDYGTDTIQAFSDGYDAGFAAALSEHEQVGWYDPERQALFSMVEIRAWSNEADFDLTSEGYEPVYRRSVQSSEVPRTPEEPTDA